MVRSVETIKAPLSVISLAEEKVTNKLRLIAVIVALIFALASGAEKLSVNSFH